MDANQVSWGQCPGVNQAPANGTLCFQSDESYLCFDDDTPKLTSYKCPLGGSIGTSADRTGNFCPYYKQRGAYRCCPFKAGTACSRGDCVPEGQVCCGKKMGNYCDLAKRLECNEAANGGNGGCCGIGLSCGDDCLTDSTYSCCGGKECSNSASCVSGKCITTSSTSSTSTTPAAISILNLPTTTTSLTSSLDPTAILATAIPEAARTDPKSACFLSTQYTSYHTTPEWFKTLPTNVQSVYASSSHATTPDLCASPVSGGMSAGAQAGVGIGAALGVLLLVALALWRFKPGIWRKVFGKREVGEMGEKELMELDVENVRMEELDAGGMFYKNNAESVRMEELEARGMIYKRNVEDRRHELGS